MRTMLIALALSALPLPVGAAAPNLQPGLYEISVQMVLNNAPIEMPVNSFRQCLTAQDIVDGSAFASTENTRDCKISGLTQGAQSLAYDFVCTLPGGGNMVGRASGTQHAAGYNLLMKGRFVPAVEGMREFTQKLGARRLGACK